MNIFQLSRNRLTHCVRMAFAILMLLPTFSKAQQFVFEANEPSTLMSCAELPSGNLLVAGADTAGGHLWQFNGAGVLLGKTNLEVGGKLVYNICLKKLSEEKIALSASYNDSVSGLIYTEMGWLDEQLNWDPQAKVKHDSMNVYPSTFIEQFDSTYSWVVMHVNRQGNLIGFRGFRLDAELNVKDSGQLMMLPPVHFVPLDFYSTSNSNTKELFFTSATGRSKDKWLFRLNNELEIDTVKIFEGIVLNQYKYYNYIPGDVFKNGHHHLGMVTEKSNVTSDFHSETFVMLVLDSAYNTKDSLRFFTKNDEGKLLGSIICDVGGNFILTGVDSSMSFFTPDQKSNLVIIKIDTAYKTVYQKKIDLGFRTLPFYSMATRDGGFVVTGTERRISGESNEFQRGFLVKFNEHGDVMNINVFGGQEISVTVFPNPASSVLSVKLSELNGAKITVINSSGALVYESKTPLGEKLDIDVNEWVSGNYFVLLSDGDGLVTSKKVIVN